MAENSWPFESADTTETQFSKWAAALAETGELSGLGVSTPSGLTVRLAAGAAIVQGFYYENTANLDLTVATPPAAGQTRLDALILKLDTATNTITASIKTGTANSSGGALPSLTQTASTWEHRLRTITVPGGVGALVSGNIGAAEPPSGMRIVPYVGAPPSLGSTPRALGLNLATMQLSYWNGSAWTPIAASIAWGSVSGKPTSFPTTADDFSGAPLPVAKGGTGDDNLADITVGNATKVGGRQIFVQSGTPAGPSTNDLWFW